MKPVNKSGKWSKKFLESQAPSTRALLDPKYKSIIPSRVVPKYRAALRLNDSVSRFKNTVSSLTPERKERAIKAFMYRSVGTRIKQAWNVLCGR